VGSEALRFRQFKAAAIVFTSCPANVRSDGDDKVAGVARAGRPAATRAVAMEELCRFAVNFPGDRAANASASHGFLIVHSHSSYRSFPSQFIAQGLLSTSVSAHSGSCSGNIAGSEMETSRRCACRKKGAGLND